MNWRPGPGLVITAAFLGPGTLTTATVVGARTGYALLWVLPLAIALTYVLQEVAARIPLSTDRPLAGVLAKQGPGGRVSRWVAIGSVGAVVLGAVAFQAGNLTGASLGLKLLAGSPQIAWTIACADVAFLLLWFGKYEALETILGGLVALMAGAFGLQLAVIGVDGQALVAGLVPDLSVADLGLILALLGTTVVPYNLFLHGSALQAQEDAEQDDVASMRLDLGTSVVLGGLVTMAVLLASAGTLFGSNVTSAADMALILGPLFGPAAGITMASGLAAAGLSSALTAPLAAAWAVDQLSDGPASARPPRIVWIPVLLVGSAIAMLPFQPVGLIVVAQVANALILPLLAGALLWVANRPLLGTDRNGWLGNLAGALAVLITLGFVAALLL